MSGSVANPPQLKAVRLFGGPLHGRVAIVPRESVHLRIGGFWRYRFAGRVGGDECFAIVPTSRKERRREMAYIREHAMHPTVEKYEKQDAELIDKLMPGGNAP